MSRSTDAGHFFQTSESLATSERKAAKAQNKAGNPIKLPSKLLALLLDPTDDDKIWLAEAAGEVKRVDLDTSEVTRTSIRGTAPLTSLAICPKTKTLFSGCWDKTIYATSLTSQEQPRKLTGHTDFVKCLLATSLNGKPILLSAGTDSTIIVWDTTTSTPLHKIKTPTKALQDLAIDPLSLEEGDSPSDSLVIFTASSDREIRRWHISWDAAFELPESVDIPILAHETSVYKLCFDGEGDLWTASADKTAKHLVRSRGWEADTVLAHPDFVRDVVVADERLGLVATACRDEEVRVWDASSGDLVFMYSGHFEEVTGLALCGGSGLVSISIDGTVRRWSLDRKEMARYREALEEEKGKSEEHGETMKKGGGVLTAEEEAELAELMDEDD